MAARETAPEIPRGWLASEFTDADWDRLAALETVSQHSNHRNFDTRDVERLHARGYRVMLYTVNEVETAEALLDAGVDGLFTDNLAEFAARFASLI